MRSVGLIVEYNPFHNGHLHHLRESLRASGAEVAVAVMSGHFLQRGEPALLDKWWRTEMALAAGVDVVVELPLPFACNSAPHFADGAVRLLTALAVDSLCFGSEAGCLPPLQRCAELLLRQEEQIRRGAARQLRSGIDYPTARAGVAAEVLGADAAALATPNNILGIEYLRALRASASPLQPLTVPRRGAGFHDPVPVGAIASATALRRMLRDGEALAPYLPPPVQRRLQTALAAGRCLDETALARLVIARLLQPPETLAGLYQAQPGLAQRLHRAALVAGSWEELVTAVAVRQLTRTRVQRLLCHALFDLGAGRMATFLDRGPLYLRLLGCSPRGEQFLAATRKRRLLPLLGNLSRAAAVLRRHYGAEPPLLRTAHAMLQADLLGTRLYRLLLRHPPAERRDRDYFEAVRRGAAED